MLSGGAEALRNQPGGLADLHGLGPPLSAELVKQPAGMGLYGVFANKEPVGNLPIAQPGGDEPKNLQFTRGDAEFANARLIHDERTGDRHRNFLDYSFLDDLFLDDRR